jgi:predicted PurR-regulated permease PerM
MTSRNGTRSDLTRTTLQILALGVLVGSCVWILRPFLVASAWATTIVVATWPLLLGAERRLGGRRSLAVATMTTALLLILMVPLYLAIATIVDNAASMADWSQSLARLAVQPPPPWIAKLPVVGAKLATRWEQVAAGGPEGLAVQLSPYAQTLALWFVGQVGSIGRLLLQFLLTVVIAAILYASGETAARGATRFARRLAGPQGENAVHLAAQAVRAVALGVVVTAIVQSAAGGLGLAIAGVPFTAILTAMIFILTVAQVGAAPVLIPATIWVYARTGAVGGTVFLAWSIFCVTFDNFLRPLLIKRGADLPLLLIFAGVIGGLVAFGVIGLFIGPVVLAVAYTLLADWVSAGTPADEHGHP